jgi:hypothetical protein
MAPYILRLRPQRYTPTWTRLSQNRTPLNQHPKQANDVVSVNSFLLSIPPPINALNHMQFITVIVKMLKYIRMDNTKIFTYFRIVTNLTFRGPCIMIYSYNKNQRDALFLKFILIKKSTCFG